MATRRNKAADVNDVMLNPLVFHQPRKQLTFKPSVDIFANAEHYQLQRYYSRVADPKAACVDAFKANWQADWTPYANSAWPLIHRVLQKVCVDQVRIIVVIPDWVLAPWYAD